MSSALAWQLEVDRLFRLALDADEHVRAAVLAREAGTDPRLRRAVDTLLEAATADDTRLEPGAPLRGPVWDSIVRQVLRDADPRLGARVGPWRLVRELGRGGMSVVYLAERADGRFAQTAAVKLLPTWAVHPDAIQRFERERRILARLEHPHIARLLDGGETDDGQPYLAMEFVDGVPITEYCRARSLSVPDTVQLIAVVARAVAAAHRRLVVHRDIKPSNILVTAAGEVKLLDFGIARLLEDGAPAPPVRALTLEYASPEMLRGEPVTTSSDVYQLGLLLYELLAGRKPHDVAGASLELLSSIVCERVPPPPSAVAGRRGLGGDLDHVVSCALAKDPARRYASADHFADDLLRHLARRPIAARQGARLYAAGRWLSRHRAAASVAAAALVLGAVGLSAYVVTVTRQTREIERQSARSTRAFGFLSRLLLAGDPGPGAERMPEVAELLDEGVRRVAREFPDDPDAQAELLALLARAYISRGDYRSGVPLIERAIALQRRPGGDSLALAAALRDLGRQLHFVGRYRDAEGPLREALALREANLPPTDWRVAEALRSIGCLYQGMGRYAEAEPLLRRGYELTRAETGLAHLRGWQATIDLADLLLESGRPLEALGLLDAALAGIATTDGQDTWTRLWLENSRAEALVALGRLDEAAPLIARVLAERRAAHGAPHALTAESVRVAAALASGRGRHDEAEALVREARAMYVSVLTDRHAWVARADILLGDALAAQGRATEAADACRSALALLDAAGLADHPFAAVARAGLAATGAPP